MEGIYMERLKEFWIDFFLAERSDNDWWKKKKELWKKRQAKIVRINGHGQLYQKIKYDDDINYQYMLHLSYLMSQNQHFYMEEQVIPLQFRLCDGKIIDHREIINLTEENHNLKLPTPDVSKTILEKRFTYDRRAAVQYAERWWNSYNPAYEKFTVDCTNYISQCLRAGGAPMRGATNRNQGWWYQGDNWSFSWAVAHSLRWYLSGSTEGLQGKEVQNAAELSPGDVICYDFQGDDRWDHNTIVVAKDAEGMPLVNAHTDNSRHRYWSYEDSTAWTPNMKYKFFQIGV